MPSPRTPPPSASIPLKAILYRSVSTSSASADKHLQRPVFLFWDWLGGRKRDVGPMATMLYLELRTYNCQLQFKTATAASPAHPSDAPSVRRSAATRSNWPSARNTILLAGQHRRSASSADCASIPPPAVSSSLDPGGEMSFQRPGKLKPAEKANSKPPRNRSGKGSAALASPLLGWRTTSSRCGLLPCGYSAAQSRSWSSPARR